MSVETETRGAKRKKTKPLVDNRQLGLFDLERDPGDSPAPPRTGQPERAPAQAVAIAKAPRAIAATPPKPERNAPAEPILLTVEDMPAYPPDLCEAVDKMLAELKLEHMLMTYRAIKECFGISRATVARRVKDGLVPGTRFLNGRVLEDGPVRRFDRTQVRWLLLAVRSSRGR